MMSTDKALRTLHLSMHETSLSHSKAVCTQSQICVYVRGTCQQLTFLKHSPALL